MSKWEMVKWSDVIEIKNGRNQTKVIDENGRFPIYGSGGIMGYANDYICNENTVIIGRKGNINKPIFVDRKFWNVDTAFGLEAIPEKLYSKYLYYFCLKFDFERLNTTTTIPSLTKVNLLKIDIPLPPLDMQKQISATLDSVMENINLRKQWLAELDNLIKSVFYDMFGDPVTNDKGWDKTKWNDIFNTTTGKLDSNAMVENGKYPFFTCAKEVFAINQYAFDCEALLLAGNNAAAIYDVKHYIGKFNAYQRTYVITLKNKNHSYYLYKVMLEQKLEQMRVLSKGTNTKYLTLGILNDFEFIVPPLEYQHRFTDFIRSIDGIWIDVKKSIEESQQLFESLMSRYFDSTTTG